MYCIGEEREGASQEEFLWGEACFVLTPSNAATDAMKGTRAFPESGNTREGRVVYSQFVETRITVAQRMMIEGTMYKLFKRVA